MAAWGLVGGDILGVGQAVVAVEGVLVIAGEVAVFVQVGCVLDALFRECEVEFAVAQGVAT